MCADEIDFKLLAKGGRRQILNRPRLPERSIVEHRVEPALRQVERRDGTRRNRGRIGEFQGQSLDALREPKPVEIILRARRRQHAPAARL